MKFRKAFSLAEILVVVAILSVIAIFGFKIAGDGIDRAYNDYIYTGYEGLNIAIKAAEEANKKPNNDNSFNAYIANLLGRAYNKASGAIITSNGIRYIYHGRTSDNIHYYEMQTPKRANNNEKINHTCLAYYPNGNYNQLLPLRDTKFNDVSSSSQKTCKTTLDIQQRPDLLLFYFDDGIAGRTIGGNYHPILYYTVRDAVCSKYGTIAGYDCTGINKNNNLANIPLKYAHPKRIATR